MSLPQRANAAVPGHPVKLFYCSGICNFGDELSPYIVEKITGRKVLSAGREEPALYAIGSLLNYDVLHGNNVVWGTGLISETSARILPKLFPFKRNIPILIQRLEKVSSEKSLITAVRGRLTRDVLTKAGHDCPEVYGDPGTLLREFFCPSEEKHFMTGLILHYSQDKLFSDEACAKQGIRIISLVCTPTRTVETIIAEIWQCGKIISSSLHGLILAHTYGVPAQWIQIKGRRLHQSQSFKFLDYFSAIGVQPPAPIVIWPNLTNLSALRNIEAPSVDIRDYRLDQLLKAFPYNSI